MKFSACITLTCISTLIIGSAGFARGDLRVRTYDDAPVSLLKPISALFEMVPTGDGVEDGPLHYFTDTTPPPNGSSSFLSNLPELTHRESFSVLWTGWIDVTQEGYGTYSFGTTSDDQSAVYLDLNHDGDFDDPGELVVDATGWHTALTIAGEVELNSDAVRIAIGYHQTVGGARMEFRFKKGADVAFNDMSQLNGASGHFFIDPPPAKPTVANLWAFGLPSLKAVGSGTNLTLTVPYGTDVTTLAPTYTMSALATCDKPSGSVQNFTTPQTYTVTSGDGLVSQAYVVTVQVGRAWIHDGDGSWDDPTHWGGQQIASGSDITAAFDGIDINGDRTVTIDSARVIGTIIFGDALQTETPGGWILHDNENPLNAITLSGSSPTIRVNALGAGKDATISARLSGTAGLIKSGPGILTLTNPSNDYAGDTRIMEGTLRLGGSNGSVGPGTIYNYGTLVFDNTGSTVISNRISSPGPLLKEGPGTVLLNGTNVAVHGDVTVNEGTLAVDGYRSYNRMAYTNRTVTINNPNSTFEIRGDNALEAAMRAVGFAVNQGAILRVVSGGSTAIGSSGQSYADIMNLELNGGIMDLAYSGSGTAFNDRSCLVYSQVKVGGDAMSTIRYGSGATDENAGLGLFSVSWMTTNFDVSDVTAGPDLSVSAQLEGGGFTKTGAGTMLSSGNNRCSSLITVSEGLLQLSGDNRNSTGSIAVNGGLLQFDSLFSIPGTARSVSIPGGTVAFGPDFGSSNIPTALGRITTSSSTGTIAADNHAATDFNFSVAGLSATSLGATGNVTYSGTVTPHNGIYRLGGGGGTLTMIQPLSSAATSLTVNGNVILRAPSDFSGNTTVTRGTLTLDDTAVAKFVVTNSSHNKFTGTGKVVFNGDFHIDTSAVNVGNSVWSLVEMGGFAEASFGTSFTVLGFTPSGDGVTWTKSDPARIWSFSEVTGVLTATAPRTVFNQWAAENQLDGPDADPMAMPFNDGITNLLKYAFNMHSAGPDTRTLSPDGTAGLPRLSDDSTVVRLEFIRRKNSGLSYVPKQSSTLDGDSWLPMTGAIQVSDTADSELERVVIEQPQDGNTTQRFFRVEVSMP